MAFAAKVTVSPDKSAHRFILSGRPKIGKTFLVSTIPDMFIIPIEEGLKGASPDHSPAHFDRVPRNHHELIQAIETFSAMNAERPDGQKWRHLALDSMTGIEALVHKAAMGGENVAHMEGKEYKVVWTAAVPKWRAVQDALDKVRRGGIHVWIITHASEAIESDAESGDTWRRWDLAFAGSGASLAEVRNLWRSWTDHVFFIDWIARVSSKKGKRATARYTARILHTRESPTHFAGTRSALPPTIPATWPDLQSALKAGSVAPVQRLRAAIAGVLPSVPADLRVAIEAEMQAATTGSALSAILSRAEGLAALAAEAAEESESEGQSEPAPEEEEGEEEQANTAAPESGPRLASERTVDDWLKAVDEAEQGALPELAADIAAAGLSDDDRATVRAAYLERRHASERVALEASL